jgi:hypothetical protein
MRGDAFWLVALAALQAASCSDKPPGREYFYGNYGNAWTKYVPPHDSLEQFRLSPDGNHVSYLIKRDGKWQVGINGRHYKEFQGVYPGRSAGEPEVVLSPDGRHAGVVYQREPSWRPAREAGRAGSGKEGPLWFVEVDRRIFGGFDGDFTPELQFSPEGNAFGLVYKKADQYYIQIVDTTFGPYDRADFAITREGEVVIAYLEGSYVHVERVGRVGGMGR